MHLLIIDDALKLGSFSCNNVVGAIIFALFAILVTWPHMGTVRNWCVTCAHRPAYRSVLNCNDVSESHSFNPLSSVSDNSCGFIS